MRLVTAQTNLDLTPERKPDQKKPVSLFDKSLHGLFPFELNAPRRKRQRRMPHSLYRDVLKSSPGRTVLQAGLLAHNNNLPGAITFQRSFFPEKSFGLVGTYGSMLKPSKHTLTSNSGGPARMHSCSGRMKQYEKRVSLKAAKAKPAAGWSTPSCLIYPATPKGKLPGAALGISGLLGCRHWLKVTVVDKMLIGDGPYGLRYT